MISFGVLTIIASLMLVGLYVAYSPSVTKLIDVVEFLSIYSCVLMFHKFMFENTPMPWVATLFPLIFAGGLLMVAKLTRFI